MNKKQQPQNVFLPFSVSPVLLFLIIFLLLTPSFASPQRIISLNPSVTEILFSLKLDDKIIAVTNNCDYPNEAKNKTKIGDMSLNYEKIVSLRPDLIIAEGSIFKESLNKLKAMKMPLFIVSCNNIEQFKNSFLLIGQKTGKYELSLKLVKDFESKLNKIKSKSKNIKNKPKVFVEVWNQPIMTAGKGTFFNDIIKIAGGVNIAEKLNKSYPVVNTEFLIENNPDIIILTTSKPEEVYRNTALKNINAVKNKKIYAINPDIVARPTLRLADAAEEISNWIKDLASQKLSPSPSPLPFGERGRGEGFALTLKRAKLAHVL